MNSLTLAQFRTNFPAFRATEYPDAVVKYRLALADKFFTDDIWSDEDLRLHACGLYVAHFLSLGGKDDCGHYSGAGTTGGIVTSKSVDGASVSYDNSATIEGNAGFWNATIFGRELWQLMRIICAGAVQI